MEPLAVWLSALTAAVASMLLTPLVRQWLVRRDLLDLPDPRRSHTAPTPRGGGIAAIAAMVLALAICRVPIELWWFPALFVAGLGLLGWLDDHADLSPAFRLAVQAAFATLAIWVLGGIESVQVLGYSATVPWLWTLLAVIATIWLVNLHNFMDGSDGLAAMQGVWSGIVMGLLLLASGLPGEGLFGLTIAGAFAGFLIWNRPPARIFMGDVGSMALGGAIAYLALVGAVTGTVSIWTSFLVASVFVVDATATLAARVRLGERWYTAHRQHAYQRLIAYGWSHGGVLALYAAVNVLVVLPAVLISVAFPHFDAVLAAGVALLLVGGWWVIQSATTTEKQRHE